MRIRYKGPFDAVEIAATGQVVARGQTADVDADTAKALLEQADTWARVSTKKSSKKTTPSKDEGDDQ